MSTITHFTRMRPRTVRTYRLVPAWIARSIGLKALNATIRADNVSGLTYYGKMGFVDYKVDKAVALKDGQLVDRISKRYVLEDG